MAKPVDLELRKAFSELQVKMIETSKKIHEIDSEIVVYERVLQYTYVNMAELSESPESTRTYEAVGRIFILQDLNRLKNKWDKRTNEMKSHVKALIEKREYLKKNLKESENNLREMVQLRKEQADTKS